MRALLCLLCSLWLISVSHAGYPDMPDRCPPVSTIQSVGFDQIVQVEGNTWMAIQPHDNYGGQEWWSFTLTGIQAQNASEAMKNAQAALTTLRILEGPEEVDDDTHWLCSYRNSEGNNGIALTPPEG